MTIDELVETAQKYNCMIVTKDMWNIALGNAHKLQKIEKIVKAWNDMNSFDSMEQISEILKVDWHKIIQKKINELKGNENGNE